MAESTLSLTFDDLAASVGLYLGKGRGGQFGDPAWSARDKAIIEECVKSGCRQVYYPPPMEEVGSVDWSFLKPVALLTLPRGEHVIKLPDDFGDFEGSLAVSASDAATNWFPVQLHNIGYVLHRIAMLPTATGVPLLAARQHLKGTSLHAGQRSQLVLFPIAEQDYTVQCQYYLLPECTSGSHPYTYGGMAHAETFRAACLMAAEETMDDARGIWAAKFRERLAASIALDRRGKAQLLGYNADREYVEPDRRDGHFLSRVTYNGTQY